MSKRPRAARSTKHTRPNRPAGPSRPAAATATASAVATPVAPAAPAAPAPRTAARPQVRPNQNARAGLLAERAANEYVYVARDLRRIGTFAAAVAAIMLVVWVLVDLAHVVAI